MKQHIYCAYAVIMVNMQLVASENSSYDMSQLKRILSNEELTNLEAPLNLTRLQKQLSDTDKVLDSLMQYPDYNFIRMQQIEKSLKNEGDKRQLCDSEKFARYVCRNLILMQEIEKQLSDSSLKKITDIILESSHNTKSAQSKISVIIEKELPSEKLNEWQEAKDNYNQALFVLETFRYFAAKEKLCGRETK